MEPWEMSGKEKSLRLLICGLGGVGKSALVNHFFPMKDYEKPAEEGRMGGATLPVASMHERSTDSGVHMYLCDTPGFDSTSMSNEDVIAMMENETGGRIDAVLYCISLDGSARVQHGDIAATTILTRAFTQDIWERTVVVLTFANILEQKLGIEAYRSVIRNVTEDVKHILVTHASVSEAVASQIPVVTAGYESSVLKYEQDESAGDWRTRLYRVVLEQAKVTPLRVCYNWEVMRDTVGGNGHKIICGCVLGVQLGLLCGLLLVGGYLGAFLGAMFGAGVGTIGGAGCLKVASQLHVMIIISKIAFKKWKLKGKRENPTIVNSC